MDPDAAQRLVNGMELALRYMQADKAGTVDIAKKEFPTLDPQVVQNAVERMMAENVYPASVETTPDALKISMQTQIALGNLKEQPAYGDFVDDLLRQGHAGAAALIATGCPICPNPWV